MRALGSLLLVAIAGCAGAPPPAPSEPPFVTVEGEVMRAGTFPYDPGMTIVGAIARSGGFQRDALSRHVVVTRRGRSFVVDVSAITGGHKPDVPLRAGDAIRVPVDTF